jgi:hypothetical protein
MIELLQLIFTESPLGLSIILIVGIIAIGIEGYAIIMTWILYILLVAMVFGIWSVYDG